MQERSTPWLERLTHEAGELAMTYYRGSYEIFTKDNDTPVTTADLEVDRFLQGRIRAEHPGDCILSEETTDDPDRLHAQRVWIIDPIDGTALFIAKKDTFAILIGLCVDGDPVESCGHLPAVAMTMYSKKNDGCYLNGERVGVSQRGMSEARISCWGEKFVALNTVPVKMRESNLALIELARGELDGCVFHIDGCAGEHDFVCAAASIRDAGGKVTDLDGHPLRFNKPVRSTPEVLVCSNGVIHDALLERTRAVW
ncbi:MAG: hypothetical protein HZB26_00095 [Candidatus Hydrogenedentes bacterium]|nr:hypothetical protein [Candidatus Hydrogenedentota bacterium]